MKHSIEGKTESIERFKTSLLTLPQHHRENSYYKRSIYCTRKQI